MLDNAGQNDFKSVDFNVEPGIGRGLQKSQVKKISSPRRSTDYPFTIKFSEIQV